MCEFIDFTHHRQNYERGIRSDAMLKSNFIGITHQGISIKEDTFLELRETPAVDLCEGDAEFGPL